MTIRSPFIDEESATIPTVGLDLTPGGREITLFVKGPSSGINERTGTLVLLHGLGGRQNDISWKILRREYSERFNLIVIGVNFLGTEVYVADQAYLKSAFLNVFASLEADILRAIGDANPRGLRVELKPEHHTFFCNAHAAAQCAQPLADDFWDFGCLQALDVLNALHWTRRRVLETGLRYHERRNHLLSQSAGGQLALMCLKFAPRTFASWLDIGGAYFGSGQRAALQEALTDPLASIGETAPIITVELPSGLEVCVRRRNPIGFSTRATPRSDAPLEDELHIRDVSPSGHFAALDGKMFEVLSVYGAADECIPAPIRRDILGGLRERAVKVTERSIGETDVDDVLFRSCYHEFIKDRKAVFDHFAPALFARETPIAGSGDIGGEATYDYDSPGGRWRIAYLPEPTLSFVPLPA